MTEIIELMVYNPVMFNVIVLSIGAVYFGAIHLIERKINK